MDKRLDRIAFFLMVLNIILLAIGAMVRSWDQLPFNAGPATGSKYALSQRGDAVPSDVSTPLSSVFVG